MSIRPLWLLCQHPSRGLLRDCKTSHNLREGLFKALADTHCHGESCIRHSSGSSTLALLPLSSCLKPLCSDSISPFVPVLKQFLIQCVFRWLEGALKQNRHCRLPINCSLRPRLFMYRIKCKIERNLNWTPIFKLKTDSSLQMDWSRNAFSDAP